LEAVRLVNQTDRPVAHVAAEVGLIRPGKASWPFTAAAWHIEAIGQQVKSSLLAYGH
jgi:hypothetical protein